MVAFLQLAPARDAPPGADIVGRLNRAVKECLSPQRGARPTLVRRRLQDVDGRLFCYWDIDLPELPVPPD